MHKIGDLPIALGNEFYEADPDNFEVELMRYSTEKTYDARMWQTIEYKAAGIEQQLNGGEAELPVKLRAYADVYSELWCDPRIAAPTPARREMLALASVLHARCKSLEGMEDAP